MSEKLQVMRNIAEWVKDYGWNTSYNQKNSDGYNIFHANTNSKPDLLLQKNHYNVLVEVKPGLAHQDILDGVDQIWDYASEYYSGRAIYYVNNQSISIDAFVFATKFSRSGYLYGKEAKLNCLEYNWLTDNYQMVEKPISHTRLLWRQWESGFASDKAESLRQGQADKKVVLPFKPRIGTLLAQISSVNGQISKIPFMYLNSKFFSQMDYEKIFAFERI
jgi:hypothetical protein